MNAIRFCTSFTYHKTVEVFYCLICIYGFFRREVSDALLVVDVKVVKMHLEGKMVSFMLITSYVTQVMISFLFLSVILLN